MRLLETLPGEAASHNSAWTLFQKQWPFRPLGDPINPMSFNLCICVTFPLQPPQGRERPQLMPFRWAADSLWVPERTWDSFSMCLGIDVASLRLSTLGGLLTNFLGGVGIRTYPVTAVRIHPQLWASFMGFPEKAHRRKYGSLNPLLYAHILEILIGILLLFTHFACHGDELSLYISLCDYLFKVHLSLVLVSSEGFDHSSSLNS